MSKKRLGKGLGALLPDDEPKVEVKDNNSKILILDIEEIEPNPYQPRKEFDETLLIELSQSIKEHGIIQPISVRRIGDRYQLVAGERRLRASKLAGLTTICAIEKEIDDQQMMELALIENLQRDDLNPIEEGLAYKQLMNQFDLTQDDVAKRVGKSRSAIANTLRLLNLPQVVQDYVSRETISMGHARSLLALDTPENIIRVCQISIEKEMTVRQLENYISLLKERTRQKRPIEGIDPFLESLKNDLENRLGTKIKFGEKKDCKTITLECKNDQVFQRVLEFLSDSNRD